MSTVSIGFHIWSLIIFDDNGKRWADNDDNGIENDS